MKKYFSIFTFFILAISHLIAADVPVALDMTNYEGVGYYAGLTGIKTGDDPVTTLKNLFGAKEFNPKKDTDLIRASAAGLLTRKAFIKLDDAQFQEVVSGCLPFFSTSYGFSLIHGWMLNKFAASTTPYYIGRYFSFDNFFWGMANAITAGPEVKNLIKKVWWSARLAVEADRWAFYDNMLYLPYAIELVGIAKAPTAPYMDVVIANSRTTPDAFYGSTPAEFRAAMRAKINAFLTSGALAATDNPQALLSDIMAWVLAQHINLTASILPTDVSAENFNIQKFVDDITDRAFTLYGGFTGNPTNDVTLAQIKSTDINIPGLQFGQALQTYVYALIKSIYTTINNKDQINDLIFATVKEAIGKAKRAQVASTALIILRSDEIAKFSVPVASVRLTGLTLSPKKGSSNMALQSGLQSDQTHLGELGVYFTPVIWVDGDLAILNKFELADILKTFESYLKVKEALVPGDIDATKGAYCGTLVGRTYLAQIRAWRYKLLAANGDTAVADARAFIVSKPGRDRIKASMDDRKPPA